MKRSKRMPKATLSWEFGRDRHPLIPPFCHVCNGEPKWYARSTHRRLYYFCDEHAPAQLKAVYLMRGGA